MSVGWCVTTEREATHHVEEQIITRVCVWQVYDFLSFIGMCLSIKLVEAQGVGSCFWNGWTVRNTHKLCVHRAQKPMHTGGLSFFSAYQTILHCLMTLRMQEDIVWYFNILHSCMCVFLHCFKHRVCAEPSITALGSNAFFFFLPFFCPFAVPSYIFF